MKKLWLLLALLFYFENYAQPSDFKHINFEKADNIAKNLNREKLNNLPLLVYKLTSELNTDVEKFRAIYTWVCLNIKSDHSSQLLNLKKRKKFLNDSIALDEWNTEFKKRSFKKLLRHKRTICTGYAYLLQELSVLAELKCKMVHGYGRNVSSNIGELSQVNHSWNVVWLNNKWYLSDPTWSSGYVNLEDGVFITEYNDGYFLAEPELFVKSHYPLEKEWILMGDNAPTIQDFLDGPLVYGGTFKYSSMPLQPLQMKNQVAKGEVILFQFKLPESKKTDKINLIIDSGSNPNRITDYTYNQDEELLEFHYQFKRRGLFDIHLEIDDEVITSYTVKVLKAKS